MDKLEMSQYDGIECDSDEEIQEEESDAEYYSDDESIRKRVDYDLDKMFEIVKKRDFNKWSMSTIHHKYRQIYDSDAGRKQISR